MPQPRPGPGLREGNDQDLNWLLAHVAHGDHGAFEAVYDELAAPVYGVIKKVDRVRSETSAAAREQKVAADPASSADDVPEIVEAALDRQRVRRCMDGLTELRNESIRLAYYGGYTYPQVAKLLGVALGTVKTRIRDGLIRLRDCLEVAW